MRKISAKRLLAKVSNTISERFEMNRNAFGLSVFAFTGLLALNLGHAELVRNPTAIGASIDLGQIVKGTIYDGEVFSSGRKGDNQQLTRTGVYLTESGTYNDRLTIQLTVGGLFWFGLPEGTSFQSKRIYFGPGVGQAQGIYSFGSDTKNPVAKLQFGLFNHKYSESVNLGEYLFRSGTYPAAIVTGGWSYINSAGYMAQGMSLTVPLLGGKLNNDFTLFMERDLEPTNDFSPGYVVSYKPVSFFEVGAGVVWAHAISLNSDRLTPKAEEGNKYSLSSGRPITHGTPADTCPCGYYTFKGFKTMARVSLDIGTLLKVDGIHPGDFKLYSESALLGVKNQPYYYNKKSERMPIMGGLDIPTFGLLDKLAFEMEYHKSRFPNDIGSVIGSQTAIPVSNGDPYVYDVNDPRYATAASKDSLATALKKDDVKWTLYARRHINSAISVYAQAANDYMRNFNSPYATPAAIPVTSRPSDWYYIIRLEFGI